MTWQVMLKESVAHDLHEIPWKDVSGVPAMVDSFAENPGHRAYSKLTSIGLHQVRAGATGSCTRSVMRR